MNISAQISYYPLGKKDFKKIISNFLKDLDTNHVKIEYSSMSTVLYGEKDIIMDLIDNLIDLYFQKYDSILEVKLSNSCPKI